MERHYPSDVSDAEWALFEPFFIDRSAPRKRGRSETPEFARRSFNAIRYLLKTGCQWRMPPKEYPSRTTVHDAFTRWTKSGLWERINSALREQRRMSVKKRRAQRRNHRQPKREVRQHRGRRSSGYDAGKLECFLSAAGALFGHTGGPVLSLIKGSEAAKGFVLLPRGWVVERTFGWLVKARRLVRDHERNPRHHEALVYIAMIGHSARHLTASSAF